MLAFSLLSSGSKANCLFVSSGNTRVLVDCGLSARETCRRLAEIGIEPDSLDAIVISHEHWDHISGVRVLSKKHAIPVYANESTFKAATTLREVPIEQIRIFESGHAFMIKEIMFEPFSVLHDAEEPVQFKISNEGSALGVLTDVGQVTALVRERMRDIDALILEANHDTTMLWEGKYPWELKQRIAGRFGHLSNEHAGDFLKEVHENALDSRLQLVIAAHISENNNTPELAVEAIKSGWGSVSKNAAPSFCAGAPSARTELFQF